MNTIQKLFKTVQALKVFGAHKSYMVALNKIQRIDNNLINIKGVAIPIGSSYKSSFMAEVLGQK